MNDPSSTSDRAASDRAAADRPPTATATATATIPEPADILVLASASPRRREILGQAGVPFEVRPSSVDEAVQPGERPAALVERLAREKAEDVARAIGADRGGAVAAGGARPVLGADTIVVLDDEILGKPRDPEHAIEMLSRLVGRGHDVLTGVALAWSDGRATVSLVVASRVEMRPASRDEIAAYVATGESLDKAGAYALQGGAIRFVTRVDGSRTNVIGLPQEETLALLAQSGALAAREPA